MRCAALVSFALLACGGTTTSDSDSGAQDSAAADSTTGCLAPDPAEGSPCTAGQSVCSDNIPVHAKCCRGYNWACLSGKWVKLGLGCPCIAADAGHD